MRRVAAAAVLALAVVLVVPSLATTAVKPQTLRFVDVTEKEIPINGFTFQREPRAGDQIGFVDGLYAWAGTKRGARVGRVEATLTFLSEFGPAGATAHFDAQAFLPGGSLVIEGNVRLREGPGRFTLAIIGGTGKYAGAGGSIIVRDIGNDNSAVIAHIL